MATLVYPERDYPACLTKGILENSFINEKDLCDYIETHIEELCREMLGVELEEYKREYDLLNRKGRIDFWIKTKDGKIILIECKSSANRSSQNLSSAIGQILGYQILMREKADRLVLISTLIDPIIPRIIKKFNLPIEYFGMDKHKFLRLKRQEEPIDNLMTCNELFGISL